MKSRKGSLFIAIIATSLGVSFVLDGSMVWGIFELVIGYFFIYMAFIDFED